MQQKKFSLQPLASEEEDANLSLKPYQIMTYPADFTLELLVQKWSKGEIRKEGFQRRYVWPQVRASKLIESFLLGLPVPPIYLYEEKGTGNKLIVDGHQRLRTVVYFFSGWFGDSEEMAEKDIVPFSLTGLHRDSPYADETFQSLGESDPEAIARLKDVVLRSIIMRQIDPDDESSIFEIFSRFNTGGMPLMPQEIRNCVLSGDFNDLIRSLNQNEFWRQIVGSGLPDRRMRDAELILRFFALYKREKRYAKPMKNFLNDFMRVNRYLTKSTDYGSLFTRTSKTVLKSLGPKPFHVKRGLNAAVFDSVFTAFAENLPKAEKAKPSVLRSRYESLLNDSDFQAWTSSATTDDEVVRQRIARAKKVFFSK